MTVSNEEDFSRVQEVMSNPRQTKADEIIRICQVAGIAFQSVPEFVSHIELFRSKPTELKHLQGAQECLESMVASQSTAEKAIDTLRAEWGNTEAVSVIQNAYSERQHFLRRLAPAYIDLVRTVHTELQSATAEQAEPIQMAIPPINEPVLDIRVLSTEGVRPADIRVVEIRRDELTAEGQLPITVIAGKLKEQNAIQKTTPQLEINVTSSTSVLPITINSTEKVTPSPDNPISFFDPAWIEKCVRDFLSIYGGKKIDTPIHYNHHLRQSGPTCVAYTAVNALRALRRTQDVDIANFRRIVAPDQPPYGSLTWNRFFSENGVPHYPVDSLLEIADALERGGVVVIMNPGSAYHAILISGLVVKNDVALFRVNDSLTDTVRLVEPRYIAKFLQESFQKSVQDRSDLPNLEKRLLARLGSGEKFITTALAVDPGLQIIVK
jgi:hypothetical protein